MDVADFCLLARFVGQLDGHAKAPANGQVRMSTRSEIREFFGIPDGGTTVVVDGGWKP